MCAGEDFDVGAAVQGRFSCIMCDQVDQLPLFPYNSVGVYLPIVRIPDTVPGKGSLKIFEMRVKYSQVGLVSL